MFSTYFIVTIKSHPDSFFPLWVGGTDEGFGGDGGRVTFLFPHVSEILCMLKKCARAHHPQIGFIFRIRIGRLCYSKPLGTRKIAIHIRSG